jgi:hypothetical protein
MSTRTAEYKPEEIGGDRYSNPQVAWAVDLRPVAVVMAIAGREMLASGELVVCDGQVVLPQREKVNLVLSVQALCRADCRCPAAADAGAGRCAKDQDRPDIALSQTRCRPGLTQSRIAQATSLQGATLHGRTM